MSSTPKTNPQDLQASNSSKMKAHLKISTLFISEGSAVSYEMQSPSEDDVDSLCANSPIGRSVEGMK